MNEYEPIAIIGYGCLYPPKMVNPEEMWNSILCGDKGVREVTKEVWDTKKYYSPDRNAEDKTYCKKTGYLDNVPKFG